MIKAVLKVHVVIRLQHLIEGTVNKTVQQSFKDAYEKAFKGTHTELYQMVERAAAKAIYLREAYEQINNYIRRLAKSRECTQPVLHQLIQ